MELTTKKNILERVLERLTQLQKDLVAEEDSKTVVDFLCALSQSILDTEPHPNNETIFNELVKRNKNFHFLLVSEVLDKYKSKMIEPHYDALINSVNLKMRSSSLDLKHDEYCPSSTINMLMTYNTPKAGSYIFFAHEFLVGLICISDGRNHLYKVVQQELIPTVESMLVECITDHELKATKPVTTMQEEAADPISGLTCSQRELLYLLTETCSDAIQATQKVLRHGYESVNPLIPNSHTNREFLEKELGKVDIAIKLLSKTSEVDLRNISDHSLNRETYIRQWLHYNNDINSGEDK